MCTRELWSRADLQVCILLLTLMGFVTLGQLLFYWLTEFTHDLFLTLASLWPRSFWKDQV